MLSAADLPDVIPLFPLPGALLLPRARLPLHIFEPRYLAMLDDCLKTGAPADRAWSSRATARPGRRGELQAIGCAGRLTGFSETEDGRYMISLTGISRFRLMRQVEGFAPYLRGEVAWTGFERDMGHSETRCRLRPARVPETAGPVLRRARAVDRLGVAVRRPMTRC